MLRSRVAPPEVQAKRSAREDSLVGRADIERVHSLFRLGVRIFLLSFSVRLVLVIVLAPYRNPIWSEVQNIPLSLVRTGVYGDPFGVPTGPTAHYMPLYSLCLALVFKAFGTSVAGEVAQYVFNIICSSLMYSVLPAFAAVVRLPLRAGVIAGALGALVPLQFLQEIRGGDTSVAALCMIAFAALFFRAAKGDLRPSTAVLAGVAVGLGALTSPSVLAPAVGLLVLVSINNRSRLRQVFRFDVIIALLCCGLLTPWTVRNYFALGYPVVLRSNLGIELQVSNNDLANARFEDAPLSAAMRFYHPMGNPKEAEKVRAVGEVAYNHDKIAQYKQWVAENPDRFLELIGERFLLFWFPLANHLLETIGLVTITILALCGIVIMRRRCPEVFWIVISIWLTYPDLYYFIQAWHRYRMPIEWTFLLCAGFFLGYLVRAFRFPEVTGNAD